MYHFDQKISMQTKAYSIYFLTENSENFDLLETTFGDLYGQCFPYEAVTGKIYHLKQHFLPPATKCY